ncbi:LCP family protein [Patescibacteria group bacterium]
MNQKITIENSQNPPTIKDSALSIFSSITQEQKDLKSDENGRINILLLGIAGKGKPGGNLTDTIMLMSVDTQTNKIALLSLPRDLYTEIPDAHHKTKINSIYQYGINHDQGIDPLLKTIESITDLPVHYFLVLNFDGFTEIINDIDGITITNERDIYDPRYPGPNYSYELFELEKGVHKLDGATALKYARQRHGDPEGDFGRAKRQQQVIQATKNKMFSAKTFLNIFTINKLLNTLGDNIKTNIQVEELENFLSLAKRADTQNITNAVVDAWKKDSLLRVSHVYYNDTRAFILIPRIGNYSEIQELSKNIFDLTKINQRKENIKKEAARIAIINQSDDKEISNRIKKLLNGFGIADVSILKSDNHASIIEQTKVTSTNKKQKLFSLDEIVKKIPATLSNENVDLEDSENYDLILYIGNDLKSIYNYEEGSIEEMNNTEYDQLYIELMNQ